MNHDELLAVFNVLMCLAFIAAPGIAVLSMILSKAQNVQEHDPKPISSTHRIIEILRAIDNCRSQNELAQIGHLISEDLPTYTAEEQDYIVAFYKRHIQELNTTQNKTS